MFWDRSSPPPHPPPPQKKMYQLWGCCNINLWWYLGGGKLAFLVNKVKMQPLLFMTWESRSGCCALWRFQHLWPQGRPITGGMPPASLGKPNSPTLDWLDWSLAHSNTARKWKPTGNLKTLFQELARTIHHIAAPCQHAWGRSILFTTSKTVGTSVWLCSSFITFTD